MSEHRTPSAQSALRVVATSIQGLEGARVELVDLTSERHPDRVALRFGDSDTSVSLTDDLPVMWALIVEADRQLAHLVARRRPR
jgi:hypothetical protein